MILDDPLPLCITLTPRPNPEANALKTGSALDCPRVPEDELAINSRSRQWFDTLRPQNLMHAWMADQISIITLRIDRNGRIERRQRDRAALRAGRFWDEDRRLEAEILGEQIEKKPAITVNKLRQTPQGCDWLIARWAGLLRVAERDREGWNADQNRMAFCLLGVRPDEQSGPPGERFNLDGQRVGGPTDVAELARNQINRLVQSKQEVSDVDAIDRAMTMSDYTDETTPESKSLRRQNAELHRRLKWYIDMINTESPYRWTNPRAYEYLNLNSVAETPGPTEVVTPPAPPMNQDPRKARVATAEHDEDGNIWPYLIAARKNEEDTRRMAREEARREKKRKRLRA